MRRLGSFFFQPHRNHITLGKMSTLTLSMSPSLLFPIKTVSPLWSVCGFPTQLPTCHYFVTGDANVQIASISEELAKKTEDAARQQEEITHLLSQIVDLQKKAKSVRLLCLWMTRQWPCGGGTDG